MRRPLAALTTAAAAAAIALIPTAGQAGPTAQASARLTKARAETLIERKVKRIYHNRIAGRLVLADCRRITRRFYDCEYSVFKGFDDGFNEGLYGDEGGSRIYKYQGTGSVRRTRSGATLVRVSRPS